MKLPKTRPWRQDVHGELLVGILLGPSAHGPGHADLGFPVGLEPLRNNRPAKQRSTTVTSATAAVVGVNIARDKFGRFSRAFPPYSHPTHSRSLYPSL